MSHYLKKKKRGAWRILIEAGLWTVVFMGLALIGLAIGFAFGTGMVQP